jgi:hypothetical protein
MIVKGRARGTQEHSLGYTGYPGTIKEQSLGYTGYPGTIKEQSLGYPGTIPRIHGVSRNNP